MSKNYVPYAQSPKSGTRGRHIAEKDGAFAAAAEDLIEADIHVPKHPDAMLHHKRGGKVRERAQTHNFDLNK